MVTCKIGRNRNGKVNNVEGFKSFLLKFNTDLKYLISITAEVSR
jgi:hypothetical protein